MRVGITYFGLAGIFVLGGTALLFENPLFGHLLFVPAAGLLYLGSQDLTDPRDLGIGYLATSVLFVLVGVFLGLSDFLIGDILLVAAIGFIFLGSTELAEHRDAPRPGEESEESEASE